MAKTFEQIVRDARYHTWWMPSRAEYSDKSEKIPKMKHPANKAVTRFVPSRRGGAGEKGDS